MSDTIAPDPLDMPLPCDIHLPGMKIGKGVELRVLVDAAARWKRAIMDHEKERVRAEMEGRDE